MMTAIKRTAMMIGFGEEVIRPDGLETKFPGVEVRLVKILRRLLEMISDADVALKDAARGAIGKCIHPNCIRYNKLDKFKY